MKNLKKNSDFCLVN